jgi:hypothetical protein
MKKKLYLIFLFVFLLNSIGCEAKSVAVEPERFVVKPVVEEVKATIPLEERRFIYINNLEVEQKEINTTDKKGVKITYFYPIISGLKDKTVQDKIKKELEEIPKKLLTQFEASFVKTNQDYIIKLKGKSASAHISYSYNNVIVVEYNTFIETLFKDDYYTPTYKHLSYVYDLNTGEKIELTDVFKPGFDYNSKINDFICKYIIENNYDDYEYEKMSKPFQGIKKDQSFSLSIEGLRIILDEKNDEFFYEYADEILIPYKYLGDDYYIFDRYFDEDKNIFEKENLSKKLLQNKLEFKTNNLIRQESPRYNIYVMQGEFINVPNKEIEKKLNAMVVSKEDLEDFKYRAENYTGAHGSSNLSHNVNIFTNAGGYLSMAVFEDKRFGNVNEVKRTAYNYDFNLNKEIQLKDLFVAGTDITTKVKSYIKSMSYDLTDDMLQTGVEAAIKNNIFFFEESGVCIYFSPEGAKLDEYQEWVWIPFDEFGIENIKLFN